MNNKKYPQMLMNDIFFKFSSVFVLLSMVIILIFFNNNPTTYYEEYIYNFLIKNVGVYSHIYSFQSQIISNLLMAIIPLVSIYLSLTTRFYYISEDEVENLGGIIEKRILKIMVIKVLGILSLLLILGMFVFCIYFYKWDLQESEIDTLFISDNIVWLICLPYLFYLGMVVSLTLVMIIILHPIKLLRYHIYLPKTKKEKLQFLMEKRKSSKNK